MTLAPSIPDLTHARPVARLPYVAAAPTPSLAVESVTVDVTELVAVAERLDRHALSAGERVSLRGLVARALLVAGLRHPGVDARWPMLPDEHGMRASELTAALDGATLASELPDDVAVLSVGGVLREPAEVDGRLAVRVLLPLSLSYDPRRRDAVAAARLMHDLAELLGDPFELIARS